MVKALPSALAKLVFDALMAPFLNPKHDIKLATNTQQNERTFFAAFFSLFCSFFQAFLASSPDELELELELEER